MRSAELIHLIDFWKTCPTDVPPYVAHADRQALSKVEEMTFTSFESYINSRSFCRKGETDFHFGLLPIPYCGYLEDAEVFVLLLNPGLSHGDYYAEYKDPSFRASQIKNLFQDNSDVAYPFHFLDPTYSWHPGFVYWEKKFNSVVNAISMAKGTTHQQSLSYLSKRIACLELSGYHSKNYKKVPANQALPSTRLMVDYVQKDLIPRAQRDEISIIVTRGSSQWTLSEREEMQSIVVYVGAETQAAHLTTNSRGGKEILRRLI